MLRKDARSYANRLSKQMDKIISVRYKIEKYFFDSYQKCANLEFTEDAIEAFKSVGRLPGDASIGLYSEINKHMETLHNFLDRWKISQGVDKKTIKLGKIMHSELVKFKNYIEGTPPDVMADATKIIMQKRMRVY